MSSDSAFTTASNGGSSSESSSLLAPSGSDSGSSQHSGSHSVSRFSYVDVDVERVGPAGALPDDDRASRKMARPGTYYWFLKGFKFLFTDETGNVYKRIKALAALQKLAASVMLGAGVIILILVSVSPGTKQVSAEICAGIVSVLAGTSGLYAAIKRKEAAQRIYFVLQIWLLSMLTTYFYVALQGVGLQWNLCHPTANFGSGDDSAACERRLHAERGKVALAIIEFITAIFSSILGLALNDAMNDAAYQKYESRSKRR
eukprot:TRINITY_DN3317_c0_g1_i2.p1 TRINITY_DN3317_c0_g1~~TRINITY_DN3317_c0_g1_i2.p1  ORF type:complete len:259 (+),score=49.65 TRINITY_DN3317_c0_g1_i2:311-1087(+)